MADALGGPALITLEGEREPPLFIAGLLHGNEPTGLYVIQRLLWAFRDRRPPRTLMLFIGNVFAARWRESLLSGQPDYNRIWEGGSLPEHERAAAVLRRVRERGVVASLDIHNNTGRNPCYALVSRFGEIELALLSPQDVASDQLSLAPGCRFETTAATGMRLWVMRTSGSLLALPPR